MSIKKDLHNTILGGEDYKNMTYDELRRRGFSEKFSKEIMKEKKKGHYLVN